MTKPVAYLTVGIPASGKTTWARMMAQDGFLDINLDDCREEICGDASDQTVTLQAVALRGQKILEAIAARQSVVISDTNLNPDFRNALGKQFEDAGYQVELVVFDTPFPVCVARNEARDRVVPLEAMKRMQRAMDEFLDEYVKEIQHA